MSLSQEEKFGHLLKPIRELAANWDINIASELEDYLEVLESVTFSVEGSGSVNFAEGAAAKLDTSRPNHLRDYSVWHD